MTKVKAIPEGSHSITPYLTVKDGEKALEFYKKAFNAQVNFVMKRPDGKLGHAEIQIGDSKLMLCEEFADTAKSPQTLGGSPVHMYFYTPNVDKVFEQAKQAGAKEKRPVEDQFYGDRSGAITDPSGHTWWIATHIEDLSDEEVRKRGEEAMKKMSEGNKAAKTTANQNEPKGEKKDKKAS